MAKWYSASETWFKPVPGGYIFQSPALAGDGRNHIVNEAQKATITNILERWTLLALFLVLLAFPLMMVVGVIVIAQGAAIWHPSPGRAAGEVLAWFVLVGVVIMFVLIGHARRRLRPLLATLPTTEQRITFREQSETSARKAPRAVLGLGLGVGVLTIVLSIIEAIYGQQQLRTAVWFTLGAAATANFGWLIVLRTRGNAA